MSRVDVDGVDSGGTCLHLERVEVRALLEVQTVDLGPSRSNEGIAGGGVVAERTTEVGDSSAVVDPSLRMQVDETVRLKVEGLGPVVRQDLSRDTDRWSVLVLCRARRGSREDGPRSRRSPGPCVARTSS